MTSIPQNVYIDKLNDIINEYNNTCHRKVKIKPIDVKDDTYIEVGKKANDKDPKFQVGNHVRISKNKNIFAKGYAPNWSEETFVIRKIKNVLQWKYVINDRNGKEIIGKFYENELQVKQEIGNRLYVKWTGYDNSFNSWIDEKDIV